MKFAYQFALSQLPICTWLTRWSVSFTIVLCYNSDKSLSGSGGQDIPGHLHEAHCTFKEYFSMILS